MQLQSANHFLNMDSVRALGPRDWVLLKPDSMRVLPPLQLRSANQFLNMDSLKEWVFVTPSDSVPRLVNFLEEALVALPCVLDRKVTYLPMHCCTCCAYTSLTQTCKHPFTHAAMCCAMPSWLAAHMPNGE